MNNKKPSVWIIRSVRESGTRTPLTDKPSLTEQCSDMAPHRHTISRTPTIQSLRRPNSLEHCYDVDKSKAATARSRLCQMGLKNTLDLPPLRSAAAAGNHPRANFPRSVSRKIKTLELASAKQCSRQEFCFLTSLATRAAWTSRLLPKPRLHFQSRQSDFQTLMAKFKTTTTDPDMRNMSMRARAQTMISQGITSKRVPLPACFLLVAKGGTNRHFAQRPNRLVDPDRKCLDGLI